MYTNELICLLIANINLTIQILNIYKNRKKINKSNYKLYKNGIDNDVLKIQFLKNSTFDDILWLEEHIDMDIQEELKDIFSKFVNYVDPLNLELALWNLSKLNLDKSFNLKEIVNSLCGSLITGYYNVNDNRIRINYDIKSTLSHEFLHMASSCKNMTTYSGFHFNIFDKNKYIGSIGNGLNEGYTELLNARIFNNNKPKSYKTCVKIVRMIECFFDDFKDMEYAYFHCDINAVYEAVCKYATIDEFFTILNELDKYADTIAPNDAINHLKLQRMLYDIIKRSDDEEKISKFESIFYENKLNKFTKNIDYKKLSIKARN